MANIILQCLYFILPAYFANMAPVIVRNSFKKLKIPIDFNKKFNGKPIFGKNKTFRGLIFGVLFAIIITYLQSLLHNIDFFVGLSLVDYSEWMLIGFLMGFGAMLGDLAESFVKRGLNYEPGKPFVPFDQLDFVIGALILVYPLVSLSLNKIIIIIVFSLVLHIIVNHFAFYAKIRKERW